MRDNKNTTAALDVIKSGKVPESCSLCWFKYNRCDECQWLTGSWEQHECEEMQCFWRSGCFYTCILLQKEMDSKFGKCCEFEDFYRFILESI